MKNTENTTAKKLTLEEIESMPRGSVVWRALVMESDEGIVWHESDPMMICVPGPGGYMLGADENSYYECNIDDRMTADPVDSYWSSEPADDQLSGITKGQYNDLTDEEKIVNTKLAAAITTRGMTFAQFSESIGMEFTKFWNAITGRREFVQWEIVKIRSALKLTDEEAEEIFFPGSRVIKCKSIPNEVQSRTLMKIKI